jgi:drug/metabolite transporter (DMT)-like permease
LPSQPLAVVEGSRPSASKHPGLAESPGARAAALRLLLSSALFAVMAAGTKLCTRRLPGPEVALVRFVFGTVTVAAAAALGHARIRPRRWRWLALRGLGGGTAVVTYFAAIGRTPVGVATLLNQTQPVFTMLFSWLLLAERPRRGALGALGLTLGGVVVIVGVRELTLHAWHGEALGVLSAVLSGIAVTSIRASRRTTTDGTPPETAWSVFFSFTLLGSVVSTPWVLPPLGHWVTPTGSEWALLLGVGAASVGAQVIMTEAIGHLTGVQSGIISQLTVPMTVALGLGFLGEALTMSFAVGAALIVAGVVLTIATTARRGPSAAPPGAVADDIVVS